MALQTCCIYIETPAGTPLGESIKDIRPWLDRHDIEPIEFKSETQHGVITLDIHFRSQDEALLFEQDFALDEVDAFRQRTDDLGPIRPVAINLLRGALRKP